jgi:hypothetical protein
LNQKTLRNLRIKDKRFESVNRFSRYDSRKTASEKAVRARSNAFRKARAQEYLALAGKRAKADRHKVRQFGSQLKLAEIGKAALKREQEMVVDMSRRRAEAEINRINYVAAPTPMEIVERGLAREALESRKRNIEEQPVNPDEFPIPTDHEIKRLLRYRSAHEHELNPLEEAGLSGVALRNKVFKSKEAAEARLAVTRDRERRAELRMKRLEARERVRAEREAVEGIMRPIEAANERKRKFEEEIEDAYEEYL